MNYFEIYPGGIITGEIVIETNQEPDEDGNILMTKDEYNEAYSRVTREERGEPNYYEGYDVVTRGDRVVLSPHPFDHPTVQRLLYGEL